jgi:hypothetical protein
MLNLPIVKNFLFSMIQEPAPILPPQTPVIMASMKYSGFYTLSNSQYSHNHEDSV